MTAEPMFFFGFKDESQGQCRLLSNMAPAPFTATDGMRYEHVEQYMHYHKAKTFGDESIAAEILAETDPKAIMKLGRKVAGFNENTWSNRSEKVVEEGCFYKFSQNAEMGAFLLSTEEIELVESSPYDRIWGIGFSRQDAPSKPREAWEKNLLGKVLMRVRQRLREPNLHLVDLERSVHLVDLEKQQTWAPGEPKRPKEHGPIQALRKCCESVCWG